MHWYRHSINQILTCLVLSFKPVSKQSCLEKFISSLRAQHCNKITLCIVTNDLLHCAAYFGMRGVGHVLVGQRMLQSHMCLWNCILDLSLSGCPRSNWTLPKMILDSCVWWTLPLSLSLTHTCSFPSGPCSQPVVFASSFVRFGTLTQNFLGLIRVRRKCWWNTVGVLCTCV